MTNLFKKLLASALTLALILGPISSSGLTVNAAAKTPALHTGNRTIYVGKTFDYNVKNKMKNSKYQWTSSNTKVATVNNKNGVVTAKRAGTAVITLKVTVGKKTYTSKATVTIKENAKKVRFINGDEGAIIDVGKNVFKYKRELITASGGPCTDRTYMSIIPETNTAGATVNGYGWVSTTKAGSFEIIAHTAVTRNQYNLGNITATSEILKVEVPLQISTKMTAANKVEIKANSKLESFTKEDFTITNATTKQVQKISSLELSDDGLTGIATIETTFANGSSYNVDFKKQNLSSRFKAAYGEAAKIEAPDQTIPPGVASSVKYFVYDENGVDVTAIYPYNKAGMDFNFSTGGLDMNGKLTLPSKGDTTIFTVSYVKADANGKVTTISSEKAKVTAADPTISVLQQWTILPSGKVADWSDPVHTIAIGETGRKLYLQFKNTADVIIDTSKSTLPNITYTSSDKTVLGIDQSSGTLYPYKEGTSTITISDGSYTKTLTVTVGAARIPTTLVPSSTNIQLSSQASINDTQSIRFELKDQYGNNMGLTTAEYPMIRVTSGVENLVTVTSSNRYVTKTNVSATTNATKDGVFTIDMRARGTGSATLLITYGGKSASINVTASQPGAIESYKPVLSSYTLDPNIIGEASTVLKIYAVDAKGLKVKEVHEGTYTLTDPNGKAIISNQIINLDGAYDGDIINSSILKLSDGVYTVTITLGPVTESTTFKVQSSSPDATVARKYSSLTVSSYDDVFTKILECLPIMVNGVDVTAFISNGVIDYTSYNESLLPSRSVTKGVTTFRYAGYRADIKVNKITFTFGNQTYTISPNADISFTTK